MVTRALMVLLALGCGMPRPAFALSRTTAARMVAAARELLGVPYELGGRLRTPTQGTDCQGVIFHAAQAVSGCGWRSFSVYPTLTVQSGELGQPVFSSGPLWSRDLDISRLEPGDMLFLVQLVENPAEGPIGTLDGAPAWVGHTGMYTGEGRWIVGDHFAGAVVEVPLAAYLEEHRDSYPGLVVLRMKTGPSPARCRKHAPMRVTRR